jgi:hypothetical protein
MKLFHFIKVRGEFFDCFALKLKLNHHPGVPLIFFKAEDESEIWMRQGIEGLIDVKFGPLA